jgi:hypothetical protein
VSSAHFRPNQPQVVIKGTRTRTRVSTFAVWSMVETLKVSRAEVAPNVCEKEVSGDEEVEATDTHR